MNKMETCCVILYQERFCPNAETWFSTPAKSVITSCQGPPWVASKSCKYIYKFIINKIKLIDKIGIEL